MEKSVFLTDNNDNLLQGLVLITDKMISIRLVDTNNKLLGYMNLFYQDNNRFYLSEIYCYDEYRGNGIATKLSELADYILKDYEGYIIKGVYYPTQMSSDYKNIYRSKDELNNRAINFYKKNDYKIINYYEYLKNKEHYSNLTEDDFKYNETLVENIVFKIIKNKEHNFFEDNGVIYNSSEYNRNI